MAAAVLLATAAIGLSVPLGPAAQAAYCSSAGVGVVVDFGALGGGVDTGCGSGSDAAAAFDSAGVTLTNDPNNPGFVCRVQSMPAPGSPCMATDAYWGLFISKQGGAWAYASQGVYTQPVRAGDSVAFVWQSSNTRKQPGTAPQPVRVTQPTPTPSAKTASAPAKSGSRSTKAAKPATKAAPAPSASANAVSSATSTTASASSAATSSASASASTSASASAPAASPGASASAQAATSNGGPTPGTGDITPVTSTEAAHSGGLPGWVPPAVIAVLAVVAGGIALARRRKV